MAAAGAATAIFFLGGASDSSESDSESSEELNSAFLGFAAALGPLPLTRGVAAFLGGLSSSSASYLIFIYQYIYSLIIIFFFSNLTKVNGHILKTYHSISKCQLQISLNRLIDD